MDLSALVQVPWISSHSLMRTFQLAQQALEILLLAPVWSQKFALVPLLVIILFS